jgi:putative peptidoglycan lipid II flippase
MLLLNRAFFSLQSNWIPTLVALMNLGLNAAFDALFYRLGTWGIPLATSVVNVAGTVALFLLLRRRLGRLELRETVDSFARILAASAVVAGLSFGTWYAVDRVAGRSFAGQFASIVLALAIGIAGYLIACRALRVRELGALLALRSRFSGAQP